MRGRAFSRKLRPYLARILLGQAVLLLLLGFAYVAYRLSGRGRHVASTEESRVAWEKAEANAVRLRDDPRDERGWIVSPLLQAERHGLAGAQSCLDVSVGTVLPFHTRANHRHHSKNESFIVWGAKALWRLENAALPDGFAEVQIERRHVAILTAPRGRAHALRNIDGRATLNLVVCTDAEWDERRPDTTTHIWKDI